MLGTSELEDSISMLYHAFRAPRRRYVVRFLQKTEDNSLTTRELAKKITSHEQNIPEQKATGTPYRNVYNALSQTHLPTLSDAEIIIYDPERQQVAPTDRFDLAVTLIDTNRLAVWGFSKLAYQSSWEDNSGPQSLIE